MYVRPTVLSCCGQGILRYQSDLLRYLGTLLFLPAFLSGAAEQKQILDVELFSDYTDDPVSPALLWCLIMCLSKYFVEVYLLFFFPSAVHPVYHCCHWDSVQQGADLLFTSLHSCSFQWSKVRVTHHPLLVTDKKWLLDFSSFRFRGCLWYTQPQYSALLDLHRYII